MFVQSDCPKCGVTRWKGRNAPVMLCPKCANQERRLNIPYAKRGYELGLKSKGIFYPDTCPECGQTCWREKKYMGSLCLGCFRKTQSERMKNQVGAKNSRWNGGRSMNNGYPVVTLPPDSPFIGMAHRRSRRIFEHRLVMAQWLGRSLEDWEVVHHRNGIRTDNRIENLELLPNKAKNNAYTRLSAEIKELSSEVGELKKLVRLTLWVIRNPQYGNTEPSRGDTALGVCRGHELRIPKRDSDMVRSP